MPWSIARHRGFVLVPVVLVLAIVGAIAWSLHRGASGNAMAAGRIAAMDRVREIAEAGLSHTVWRLGQITGCSGYTDTPTTPFGGGTYSVKVAQSSGSPVTLIAKAELPDGTRITMTRRAVKTIGPALTYTLQPGAGGQDTHVEQSQPSRNFGGSNELWLDYGDEHPLLRFDLSSLPAGSRVESAQLALYQLSAGSGTGTDAVRVHRPLRPWTAGTDTGSGGGPANGATWSTWDGVNPWLTPGAGAGTDYDPSPVASWTFASGTGWKTWDVSALARGWAKGQYPNDGVILIPTAGIASIKYASSEAADPSTRPKLVLTYRPPCGAVSPPRDGEVGLVAHWKMDETSGNTVTDASGSHHGTLSGGSWSGAVRSGGLVLDGTSNHVTVAHTSTLSITDALTVMGWIRPDRLSGYAAIVAKGTSVNVANYWFGTLDGELSFEFYDAGWRAFTTSGLDLQPGVWAHVAATFDGATNVVRLYVNGVLVHSASTTRRMRSNAETLTLAKSAYGEYWPGMLDDVRIYNRALSASDVVTAMSGRALGTAKDATVESGTNADFNFGAATTLRLRSTGPTRRALLAFDLAGVPAGNVLQKATLRVFVNTVFSRSGQPMSLSLHALSEAWVEGAQTGALSVTGTTWNNRQVSPTLAWTNAGATYATTAAATTALPAGFADGQYVEFDVTPLVQEWVDGVRANHGVILLAPGPESFLLQSRESLTTVPQLLISW